MQQSAQVVIIMQITFRSTTLFTDSQLETQKENMEIENRIVGNKQFIIYYNFLFHSISSLHAFSSLFQNFQL